MFDGGGGTRTRTGVTSQQILSLLRLPFRHTAEGFFLVARQRFMTAARRREVTLCCVHVERRAAQSGNEKRANHGARFQAVLDSRKRKVPGSWRRGSRHCAQTNVALQS